MLTREEAIKIQQSRLYTLGGRCPCQDLNVCTQCERDIIELLKQQSEQPKRIPVAITSHIETNNGPYYYIYTVVHNDGSVVQMKEVGHWYKLPSIPP